MRPALFFTSLFLALVVLALTIIVVTSSRETQRLQEKVQQQQASINQGLNYQQIGTRMLNDLATASVKDEKLREVLNKNGFHVSAAPSVSGSSTPSATP